MTDPVLLKDLLREKHWQTYRTFCRQYDQAAKRVDPTLVGSYPSRAQLHRWLSGDLKGRKHSAWVKVGHDTVPRVAVGVRVGVRSGASAQLRSVRVGRASRAGRSWRRAVR